MFKLLDIPFVISYTGSGLKIKIHHQMINDNKYCNEKNGGILCIYLKYIK